MKFKKGDRVVESAYPFKLVGPVLWKNNNTHAVGTVYGYDEEQDAYRVRFDDYLGYDFNDSDEGDFHYVIQDCLELEEIMNSPLYKALR